jgi:hypothetical protein
MLGETEEYEPLSRAAYYHANERSGGKIETLSVALPKEREIERKFKLRNLKS